MFHATVSLSADSFALGDAFAKMPDIEVEVERIAGHSREWVLPCFWVVSEDFESFNAALDEDPSVEDVVTREDFGEEQFYQVEWDDSVKQHVDAIVDMEGTILKAEARNAEWQLRIRFATQDQFEALQDYFDHEEIPFSLIDLSQSWGAGQEIGELTVPQRDALVVAAKQGYYQIPRETTLDDIADALDISTQAASERLRRGMDQLITSIHVTSEEESTL
jgi:predicted DNA binding protein